MTRRIPTLGAAVCLASVSLPARAEVLGNTNLEVERGPGALQCPDAPGVARAIEKVGTDAQDPESTEPLALVVRIERGSDDSYTATIEASGRKTGVRELRVPGRDCSTLVEALAVTLAILMDWTIREPEPPPLIEEPPLPTPPPAVVEPSRPTPVAPQLPQPAPTTRWSVAMDGAITHGLPAGWSGWVGAALVVRRDLFEGAIGGHWAPSQDVDYEGGTIHVRWLAGHARACAWPVGDRDTVELGACFEASVAQLRGQGEGFDTDREQRRPWYALGGSVRAGGALWGPLSWGLLAGALAPLQRETFSVDGLGEGYATDRVTFFAGPQIQMTFF